MPANCSADVQAVIAHVDEVLSGSNTTAINQLKDLFGLSGLSHLDDTAGAREFSFSSSGSEVFERIRFPVRNNLWAWQNLQPTSGYSNTSFYGFCDALEVKGGVSAAVSGWGLEYALPAWGNFFKTVTLPTGRHATPSRSASTDKGTPTVLAISLWSCRCRELLRNLQP